jgi:hypothetical protein
MLPPTQVRQILSEERKSLVQDEIHRTSFRMPLYFCNASTSKDVITKVKEENRLSVMFQITDMETSLSNRLNDRAASITSYALNAKVDKNKDKDRVAREKLNRTTSSINNTLQSFDQLPAKDVPARDKKTVSMMLLLSFTIM